MVQSKPKWWSTKNNPVLQYIHDGVLQWGNANRRKFNLGKCGQWVYLIFTVFVPLQRHEWFGKMITVPPSTESSSVVSSDLYLFAIKTIKPFVFYHML